MNSDLAQAIDNVMSDERDVARATASHQGEFPYGRDAEAQVTRREFCNFLFLTSSSFMVASAAFAGKAMYDAGREATLSPAAIEGAGEMEPGSALNFNYPGPDDSAILIRSKDGRYAAFGQKCTHLSCPVYYARQEDRLECPCHEGGFSASSGDVLYGPPPRPLDKIELSVKDGLVVAIGREVRGHEG